MNWAPSGSRRTASSPFCESTLPPRTSAALAQAATSATAKWTCQCGRMPGSGPSPAPPTRCAPPRRPAAQHHLPGLVADLAAAGTLRRPVEDLAVEDRGVERVAGVQPYEGRLGAAPPLPVGDELALPDAEGRPVAVREQGRPAGREGQRAHRQGATAFLYAGHCLVRAGHREVRGPGHRHLPHRRHRRDPGDGRAVHQRDPEALAEFQGLPLPPENGPVELLRGLLVTAGQADPAGGTEHMVRGDDIRGRGGMSRIVVHGSRVLLSSAGGHRAVFDQCPSGTASGACRVPPRRRRGGGPHACRPVARACPGDTMDGCQSYRTNPPTSRTGSSPWRRRSASSRKRWPRTRSWTRPSAWSSRSAGSPRIRAGRY